MDSVGGQSIEIILSCVIPYILQYLKDYSYKNKLKEDLFEDIEPEVSRFEKSYEELMINFYSLLGAFSFGSVFSPSNPSSTSKVIVENFYNSFCEVEDNFTKILKVIKNNESNFVAAFESDKEKRKILITMLSSFDSEKEVINWEHLIHSKNDSKESENKTNLRNIEFLKMLNEEISTVLGNSENTNLGKILNNKEFFACDISVLTNDNNCLMEVMQVIEKHSKKEKFPRVNKKLPKFK